MAHASVAAPEPCRCATLAPSLAAHMQVLSWRKTKPNAYKRFEPRVTNLRGGIHTELAALLDEGEEELQLHAVLAIAWQSPRRFRVLLGHMRWVEYDLDSGTGTLVDMRVADAIPPADRVIMSAKPVLATAAPPVLPGSVTADGTAATAGSQHSASGPGAGVGVGAGGAQHHPGGAAGGGSRPAASVDVGGADVYAVALADGQVFLVRDRGTGSSGGARSDGRSSAAEAAGGKADKSGKAARKRDIIPVFGAVTGRLSVAHAVAGLTFNSDRSHLAIVSTSGAFTVYPLRTTSMGDVRIDPTALLQRPPVERLHGLQFSPVHPRRVLACSGGAHSVSAVDGLTRKVAAATGEGEADASAASASKQGPLTIHVVEFDASGDVRSDQTYAAPVPPVPSSSVMRVALGWSDVLEVKPGGGLKGAFAGGGEGDGDAAALAAKAAPKPTGDATRGLWVRRFLVAETARRRAGAERGSGGGDASAAVRVETSIVAYAEAQVAASDADRVTGAGGGSGGVGGVGGGGGGFAGGDLPFSRDWAGGDAAPPLYRVPLDGGATLRSGLTAAAAAASSVGGSGLTRGASGDGAGAAQDTMISVVDGAGFPACALRLHSAEEAVLWLHDLTAVAGGALAPRGGGGGDGGDAESASGLLDELAVATLAWSPLEERVLLACTNGVLLCFDAHQCQWRATRLPRTDPIVRIAWHPDGALALLVLSDGDVYAVDRALNAMPITTPTPTPDCAVGARGGVSSGGAASRDGGAAYASRGSGALTFPHVFRSTRDGDGRLVWRRTGVTASAAAPAAPSSGSDTSGSHVGGGSSGDASATHWSGMDAASRLAVPSPPVAVEWLPPSHVHVHTGSHPTVASVAERAAAATNAKGKGKATPHPTSLAAVQAAEASRRFVATMRNAAVAAVVFEDGAAGLVVVELGAGRGTLGAAQVAAQHLATGRPWAALEVLWSVNHPNDLYACAAVVLTQLIRAVDSVDRRAAQHVSAPGGGGGWGDNDIDAAVPGADPVAALAAAFDGLVQVIKQARFARRRHAIVNVLRRYLSLLLRRHEYEAALRAAAALNLPSALEEVGAWAWRTGSVDVATVAMRLAKELRDVGAADSAGDGGVEVRGGDGAAAAIAAAAAYDGLAADVAAWRSPFLAERGGADVAPAPAGGDGAGASSSVTSSFAALDREAASSALAAATEQELHGRVDEAARQLSDGAAAAAAAAAASGGGDAVAAAVAAASSAQLKAAAARLDLQRSALDAVRLPLELPRAADATAGGGGDRAAGSGRW